MTGTEKTVIGLSAVNMGKIDLLVEEGFYTNRVDFVQTAVRNQLQTHAEQARQGVVRHIVVLAMVASGKDAEKVEKKVKNG